MIQVMFKGGRWEAMKFMGFADSGRVRFEQNGRTRFSEPRFCRPMQAG